MTTATVNRRTRVSKGMTFRKVIADSNALWKVIEKFDAKTWLVEVQPEIIEVPDGKGGIDKIECTDYAGSQDVMTAQQILSAYNSAIAWREIGEKQERERMDFCDTLTVGQIVHYTEFPPFKGNDQYPPREGKWIRYRYEGNGEFTAVALVGGWSQVELGHRRADGEESRGYHAQKVLDAERRSMHAEDLVENPQSRKQTGDRASDPAYVAALPALDLNIPPITDAEREIAALYAAMEQALEIARGRDAGNGASEPASADNAPARLAKIKQKLHEVL